MSLQTDIAATLIDIEAQLRQLDQWDHSPPPAAALASSQPFCFDTLTLPQWLQFVFLPRMYSLLETESELPRRCGIAPMAEEYFRGSGLACAELVVALERVDMLLSVE
ncbi:MAG: YqcC family protein [Halioglobus sp.]